MPVSGTFRRAVARTVTFSGRTTTTRAGCLHRYVLARPLTIISSSCCAPPTLPHQPQLRTMVMVTKTSAGSLPIEKQQQDTSNDPSSDTPTQQPTITASSSATTGIQVTDSCAKRIQSLAAKRNLSLDQMYLRVFVDAGGCSGFQYQFELTQDDDEAVDAAEDVVFPRDGARVVVDQASLEFMRGSTVDFVQEMIKSSFVVADNPQSESACGCGSSFAMKNFEANPALD